MIRTIFGAFPKTGRARRKRAANNLIMLETLSSIPGFLKPFFLAISQDSSKMP
jgi:hypothetical protein